MRRILFGLTAKDFRNAGANLCATKEVGRGLRCCLDSGFLQIRSITHQFDALLLDTDIDGNESVSDAAGIDFLSGPQIELIELLQIPACIQYQAGPVGVCNFEADICAQPIDGQPLAHRRCNRGRQHEAVTVVGHQDPQQGDYAAFRVAPCSGETSRLGQPLHVLGQLPLKKLAAVATGDADQFVYLS